MVSMKLRFTNKRGRAITVGVLSKKKDGSFELSKQVKREKHFMKVSEAYGIQKNIFDKWIRPREGIVVIYEQDTGKTLRASFSTWSEKSSQQNYGYGKQVFLSEKYMEKS